MNFRHHVAILISLAVLLIFSCSGGGTIHPSGRVSTPTDHRATAPAACQASAMAQCPYGGECANDSDCTNGLAGRCISTSPCTCRYDDCLTDADCAAGTDCACETFGGAGSSGNQSSRCVHSNCRTDADCGPGGFCSPSQTMYGSGCGSVYGWYCHTPGDACGVDTDCVVDRTTGSALWPVCLYSPERGVWVCSSTTQCAG